MSFMEKIKALTFLQKMLINFGVSLFEAFIMTMGAGLAANLPFANWNWIGMVIAFITLTQTLLVTFKLMVQGNKVTDPFDSSDET